MVAVAGGSKVQSDEVVYSLAEVFGFIFIDTFPCSSLLLFNISAVLGLFPYLHMQMLWFSISLDLILLF